MNNRTIAALALASLMVGAGVATAITLSLSGNAGLADLFGTDSTVGADEHALHGGTAGDAHGDHIGMERPAFPEAKGSVPSEGSSLDEADWLVIASDDEFTPDSGVRSGSGTPDDPYVISGWRVTGDLYIADTDACVVVKENYIEGQLTLNWNSQCVHIHHNYIRDLRVNENIERTGYATGGLIELNKITVIGQLRHYDGEFRDNVVGPYVPGDLFDMVLETTPLFFGEQLLANIDGFNQGLIHHNTFHGSVNLDLHGHHHGDDFFAPHSHYHGSSAERQKEHEHHDHSVRYTSVAFTDNKVIDPEGYGVYYDDQNHAGDDRTASSEDMMELEGDHVHYVQVDISRNVIEGAPLWIDVFGADDEYHSERNPGTLILADNTVTIQERTDDEPLPFFGQFYYQNTGIRIWLGNEMDAQITGNKLVFVPASSSADPLAPAKELLGGLLWWEAQEVPAGILLHDMRDSNVTISGNSIAGFEYGVRAQSMDEGVHWTVAGNTFDVGTAVWYDESVANPPSTDEEAEEGEGGHDH